MFLSMLLVKRLCQSSIYLTNKNRLMTCFPLCSYFYGNLPYETFMNSIQLSMLNHITVVKNFTLNNKIII